MCELVKSTSPVSVLGAQLEQLSDEHRVLLKETLRLFGMVWPSYINTHHAMLQYAIYTVALLTTGSLT